MSSSHLEHQFDDYESIVCLKVKRFQMSLKL